MATKKKLPEGLVLRGSTYHADFSINGRRIRKRLSRDFEAVRRILNELRACADRAEFGLLDNNYPIAQLRKEFAAYCEQTMRPNTVGNYRACLDLLLRHIPATRVSQLTVESLLNYRRDRLRGAPPSSRSTRM